MKTADNIMSRRKFLRNYVFPFGLVVGTAAALGPGALIAQAQESSQPEAEVKNRFIWAKLEVASLTAEDLAISSIIENGKHHSILVATHNKRGARLIKHPVHKDTYDDTNEREVVLVENDFEEAAGNQAISALAISDDDVLYAGTYNPDFGAQLFASPNGGVAWQRVQAYGFNQGPGNFAISALKPFQDQLLVTTRNARGAQMWSVDKQNHARRLDITTVGGENNVDITQIAEFEGSLFAGTHNYQGQAQLLRSENGSDWQPAFMPEGATHITSIAEFNKCMYVNAWNGQDQNTLFRTADGHIWTPIFSTLSASPAGMSQVKGLLFQVTTHPINGLQVWASSDGNPENWRVASIAGLDGTNRFDYPHATTNAYGHAYIGTTNPEHGAQLWKYEWLLPNEIPQDNRGRRGD